MSAAALVGFVLLGFAVLGGIGYLVSLFNSLIQVRNNVGKAWSNIDVLLLQRNEEIPKILDVARAYGAYEKSLSEKLTRLRTAFGGARRSEDKARVENELSGVLRTMLGVGENHPDIKADQGFRNIQERVSALEDSIADRRAFFNETVKIYNVQCEQIPQVFFARLMKFRSHPYLELPRKPVS